MFNRALELDPYNLSALMQRSQTLNALCLYSESLENIEKAINIEPNWYAYNLKGYALTG